MVGGGGANGIPVPKFNRESTKKDIQKYLDAMFLTVFRPDLGVLLPDDPNYQD